MPERDGYMPGVPCWVDASEPDPQAAVDFYGGLFGWEFEEALPPGSEGKYLIARGEAASSSIFDIGRSGAAAGGGVRGPFEGVGGGGMTHRPAGRSVPSQGSVSRRRPRVPP
jgi:hypothetical protein